MSKLPSAEEQLAQDINANTKLIVGLVVLIVFVEVMHLWLFHT